MPLQGIGYRFDPGTLHSFPPRGEKGTTPGSPHQRAGKPGVVVSGVGRRTRHFASDSGANRKPWPPTLASPIRPRGSNMKTAMPWSKRAFSLPPAVTA